jgi:tryptophan synthase alpha chain
MIREALAKAASEKRTALLPFMTAGLPDRERSIEVFVAMAEAGADAFEVGIPYSDPLMDGPIIQRGNEVSIAAGTTLDGAFSLIEAIAERTGKPLLAMTYANPIMRLGPDNFCRRLSDAGAAGIIVPDLPLEESGPLRDAAAEAGIGVVLFVSPTTDPKRMEAVAAADPVFIYGVADLGVTGERQGLGPHALDLVGRVRLITKIPLVMGVGISNPAQAAAFKGLADGVIVGSALVSTVLETSSPQMVAEQLAAFRAALN